VTRPSIGPSPTEDSADGDHDRKPPKQISLTDPQAAWVARKKMSPFFAYDANYLIDNKLGIIVDAEGTRANRSDETAVTETMIARVAGRYDLNPKRQHCTQPLEEDAGLLTGAGGSRRTCGGL
jgi:hypothetical protein